MCDDETSSARLASPVTQHQFHAQPEQGRCLPAAGSLCELCAPTSATSALNLSPCANKPSAALPSTSQFPYPPHPLLRLDSDAQPR